MTKSGLYSAYIFSCPGSSIPDLGQSLCHWVAATLEFWHKEWLLRLETIQTFDQGVKKTKRQKDKTTKTQKDKNTKGQKDKKTKTKKRVWYYDIMALLRWLVFVFVLRFWKGQTNIKVNRSFQPFEDDLREWFVAKYKRGKLHRSLKDTFRGFFAIWG